MIDKAKLISVIEDALSGTEYFPVNITVSKDNIIKVEIDSDSGVDIDFCVDLTRRIEAEFDREVEDYELEVGSAGITSPLRVPRQFERNIGKEVEVLAKDGKKHRGILQSYDRATDAITILEKVKMKLPDKKRPSEVETQVTFTPDDRNAVIPVLVF